MTVYCDRLTLRAALPLASMRLRGRLSRVEVLDPVAAGAVTAVARGVLSALGVTVEEARFFAGHLRTEEGEAVSFAARRLSTRLAFDAADRLIGESPALREANMRGGRGTVRLFLARVLWRDIEPAVARVLASRAIERTADCCVVMQHPLTFDARILVSAFPRTRLRFYGPRRGLLRRWPLMLKAIAGSVGRELRWMLPSLKRPFAAPRRARPGLLLIQEDDLSMDRSHRSQPHWLFPDEPRPTFDIYVLPQSRSQRLPADEAALRAAGVHVLDDAELIATRRPAVSTAVDRRLAASARAAGFAAIASATTRTAVALAAVWGLLVKARSLASWCAHLNVRVYLAGENYPVQSDAMQIVAEHTDVTTVSYQYSNLAFSTPVMMTTADRLVVFSKRFAPLWTEHDVAPRQVEEAGYLFDGAFALVRTRAAELRRTLQAAGATFVFCYLDESVQTDKFGFISEEDHRNELRLLAQTLLDDPSLGLIVKSQFARNSPSRRYAVNPVFERARVTGRYVELRHGVHRNIVFPAEAALAADFCIGHIGGATAALEAALAGRRCALLNPYGMRSFNDDLYARVSVVSPSMPELLHSVARMKCGEPAFAGFGDWSAILPQMDPWRDGQSSARLRAILDAMLCGGAARSGAA